jgi:hypothetical protein
VLASFLFVVLGGSNIDVISVEVFGQIQPHSVLLANTESYHFVLMVFAYTLINVSCDNNAVL